LATDVTEITEISWPRRPRRSRRPLRTLIEIERAITEGRAPESRREERHQSRLAAEGRRPPDRRRLCASLRPPPIGPRQRGTTIHARVLIRLCHFWLRVQAGNMLRKRNLALRQAQDTPSVVEGCERRDGQAKRKRHRRRRNPRQLTELPFPPTHRRRCGFPRRRAVRGAACFWPEISKVTKSNQGLLAEKTFVIFVAEGCVISVFSVAESWRPQWLDLARDIVHRCARGSDGLLDVRIGVRGGEEPGFEL